MKRVVLFILAVLFLASCAPDVGPQTIRIGVLTPLSGDVAFLGQNILRSAELAVKEMGLEGQVELIAEDSGGVGDTATAISAYRKLVDQDRVTIIIDGMPSDGTLAVAPLLTEDKVVLITPLTGGENVDTASEYLFRNGPSDIRAGTQPAADIAAAGHETVALLTDNAAYTLDIVKHFRAAYNGEIVADETVTPSQTDYKTTVTKILAAEPEAILINTADGVSSNYLFKQLHELGNTKPVYANFIAFNGNTVPVAGEDAVEGVYVYIPEFDAAAADTIAFFAVYKTAYGINPPIPFHTTGTYDAVKMAVEAQRAVGTDGEAVHDYLLANIKNWQGMNGVVSFDANGNAQTGFVLMQVHDGQLGEAE